MMEDTFESNQASWRDHWAIVVRQRRWLMGPLFLFGLLAFAGAHIWPERYRSEALILVEQQKVPEHYVTPNVATDLQDRLQSMTQQILSRTRLQRLIEQFNLYPRQRARLTTDAVIDKMREDIRIELVQAPRRQGELTAFRIYYSAPNPRVAQQITNELTSLFIEENLQARSQQSASTTSFLENQLEQARKDLAEQEQRLREYKLRYLGELPEQQQSNLQILSSLEAQLHAGAAALDRAEQQKIYLESLRAEYQAMQKSLGVRESSGRVAPSAIAEAALRDLRKQLTDLEAKYTPRHPDVDGLKEQIAQWETLRKRLEDEQSPAQEGGTTAGIVAPTGEPGLAEVASRLKAIKVESESYQREMKELRQRIGEARSHLNITPLREQQLAEVTRNYENSRQNYQSLLQKKLQSELATNLEKRQQGEQFRIIDPPSLPQKPSEPNRLQIILIGWLLGLLVGLGLVVLREVGDDTLRNEKDLRQFPQLHVLVRVPVLRSPREETREKWNRALEVVGVTLLTLLSVGIGVYTHFVG